jgi:hypothetical protein
MEQSGKDLITLSYKSNSETKRERGRLLTSLTSFVLGSAFRQQRVINKSKVITKIFMLIYLQHFIVLFFFGAKQKKYN